MNISHDTHLPLVSFLVVAKNSKQYMDGIFSQLMEQIYPKEKTEWILVDGNSEDGTFEVMKQFTANHPELNIKVLENPKEILASGWNTALANSSGDILVRVDAHSEIPPDFISNNVECILKGENIVGGARLTIIPDDIYGGLLAFAEVSRFCGGVADYRHLGDPHYTDTLAHAAYRRKVYETVGGYDSRLVRNQDNEIHHRMREAGFRFYYDPKIKSYHLARTTLSKMFKQKFGNGYWISMALAIQPWAFGLRYFIPLLFTLAVIAGLCFGFFSSWIPLLSLLSVYFFSAYMFTISPIISSDYKAKILLLILPAIFFTVHISYGLGTIAGLFKMPFFYLRNRKYTIPKPIKTSNR